MKTEDLSTPCLLIDRRRLDTNLGAMQQKAMENGVGLRPHTKTHKSIDLARLQLDLGATGLTVAKVGEAEVFVDAGFSDVRLANLVIGEDKYARIARLMEKARVSFCVDTLEGARLASIYFSEHDYEAEVLVEVDCGYGRCGVHWESPESVQFFKQVAELPGLTVKGILTHAGHAYSGPGRSEESFLDTNEEALVRVSNEERDNMLAFAVRLGEADLAHPDTGFEISVGSTPSMRYFENREQGGFRITEIKPGNYVFNDRIQVSLGVAEWRQCALTVMTTVISRHRDADASERLFLDAGKKVFTSDRAKGMHGFGSILYNPVTMALLPHANITTLSEEHAWVLVRGGATLKVGDRVRVVPNHACVVVNTQRNLFVVEDGEIVDTWTVHGQSRVT